MTETSPETKLIEALFRLPEADGAQLAWVVGEFNGWSQTTQPMGRRSAGRPRTRPRCRRHRLDRRPHPPHAGPGDGASRATPPEPQPTQEAENEEGRTPCRRPRGTPNGSVSTSTSRRAPRGGVRTRTPPRRSQPAP